MPYHYYPYPVKEISQLAAILDENRIRHVLGFDMNVILCGARLLLDDIQFIVHDEHFSAAVDLIANAGYTLCSDKECRIVQPAYHPVQIPETHFHPTTWNPAIGVGVYKKSSIYWALPDFPIEHPDPGDRLFMLSNDPRLPAHDPQGPPCWGKDLYPAKMLTPLALTETLILLLCRDVYHPNDLTYGWEQLLDKAEEYAEQHWVDTEDLQPHFRPYWQLRHSEPLPDQEIRLEELEELAKLRRMVLDSMPPPPNTRRWTDPRSILMEEKYGPHTMSKYYP